VPTPPHAGHQVKFTEAKSCRIEKAVADPTVQTARDWLGGPATYALAWGLPHLAIVAGLLLPVPARAVMWVVALTWMGAACLLNARRCGRTHCRFTGPYYLAMIIPVVVAGWGAVAADLATWLVLAGLIVLGSKFIWWVSERRYGKFS
jgi:hypothetical protein